MGGLATVLPLHHRSLPEIAHPSTAGKFVGIFLPISAFVAMGFEHCVANMFLIPMSMVLGSGVSVGTFIGRNLIPVTVGNILGGAGFHAISYSLAYGSPGDAVDAWLQAQWDSMARALNLNFKVGCCGTRFSGSDYS